MPCAHCQGSGIVRSTESVSLAVLRGLEDNYLAGKIRSCVALCSADVALYLLNQKRAFIQELERRYGVVIHVRASDKHHGANFAIEWMSEDVERLLPVHQDAVNIDAGFEPRRADNDDQSSEEEPAEGRTRRRRRRGGRRDDNRQTRRDPTDDNQSEEVSEVATAAPPAEDNQADESNGEDDSERRSRRSRRRGRRGGRRHREQRGDAALPALAVPGADQPDLADGTNARNGETPEADETTQPANDGWETPATAAASPAAEHDSAPVMTSDDNGDSGRPEETSLMARLERLDEPPTAIIETAAIIEPATAAPEPPAAPEPQPNSEPEVAPEPVAAHAPEPEAPPAEPAAVATAPSIEEPASIAEPQPEPEPEPQPEPAGDRAARSQPVASEPVIQRVVVGPNGSDTTNDGDSAGDQGAAATSEQKPARRGWWQRQFGG